MASDHHAHGWGLGDECQPSLASEKAVFRLQPLSAPQRLTELCLIAKRRDHPIVVQGF